MASVDIRGIATSFTRGVVSGSYQLVASFPVSPSFDPLIYST